jgi:hypothetical protein
MYEDAGVTKMIVGSEFGNLFYYTNIDGNISGAFNRVDTNLFKINEGVRCAPFYEDVNNDGGRDLVLGNYAGGVAFFNSSNVNSVGLFDMVFENSIKVFPNPVKDELSINFDSSTIECLTYTITDVLGNEIYKIKSFNKNIRIQTSDFANGIYFLSIYADQNNQIYQSKIIFD